jgi:hypothetical protein
MLQSQVINGGMETYTYTAFDTLPTHWSVKTNYGSLRGQTADAHGGSYAFVINSWYYYGIDMLINGTIEQADMPNQWIKAGHEVTGKPTTLKGFYKYTETLVTDSAIAEVILKKWNTLKNKPDTIAYGSTRLPPTQTYLEFEVAIKDYAVGVQPDSVVIKFTSHDPKNIGMPAVANSRYLYIDDLSLVEPVGLNETIKNDGLSCFYANNELRILNKEMKTFTLNIYSIEGTLFLSREVSEPESTINISHLSNGIYLIKTNGKINMQQKFYKD